MTMTGTPLAPWRSALDRTSAMRLAATEYQRVADQLRSLTNEQWAAPTDCPGWDVRAMAGHMLGMAEMAASVRENARQGKAAGARGGVFIDALTGLQVEEHAHLTTAQLVARWIEVAPKAAKGRKRAPFFIRRRTMPVPQHVNGVDEPWTIGYLVDVILTRDPWMHRTDIARTTGADLVLTPDHDGVLVDDVVREWAARHGQPCSLRLSGPAGGAWTFGAGGPSLELDAVDFCRTVSGRGHADGLLTTEVPF
ncbi:MAG TPA: maleylpyruvate isomerase family mycothiol-dependent enzyme [Jatrophihabitantaceae bacterium]|nr:maleylpyruvate isomerase family mycothiol-dependent enzyme [Jatrophihabitantaceae bacterium]